MLLVVDLAFMAHGLLQVVAKPLSLSALFAIAEKIARVHTRPRCRCTAPAGRALVRMEPRRLVLGFEFLDLGFEFLDLLQQCCVHLMGCVGFGLKSPVAAKHFSEKLRIIILGRYWYPRHACVAACGILNTNSDVKRMECARTIRNILEQARSRLTSIGRNNKVIDEMIKKERVCYIKAS